MIISGLGKTLVLPSSFTDKKTKVRFYMADIMQLVRGSPTPGYFAFESAVIAL